MSHEESCADFLQDLVYFLDDELDATDVAAVRLHLDACAPCLESYSLQRTVKAIVARSCAEKAPDELRQRVRVQIQQIQVTYTEG